MTPCGPNNNFYSAAGTGMGLVTEAIMVELGECHSHSYDSITVKRWNLQLQDTKTERRLSSILSRPLTIF